jgi:phosphate uptake regulator
MNELSKISNCAEQVVAIRKKVYTLYFKIARRILVLFAVIYEHAFFRRRKGVMQAAPSSRPFSGLT